MIKKVIQLLLENNQAKKKVSIISLKLIQDWNFFRAEHCFNDGILKFPTTCK